MYTLRPSENEHGRRRYAAGKRQGVLASNSWCSCVSGARSLDCFLVFDLGLDKVVGEIGHGGAGTR